MIERRGDLFGQDDGDWIVLTTNAQTKAGNLAIMGAGVAKRGRDLFHGIDRKLGTLLREQGSRVRLLGSWPHRGRQVQVVALPTKVNWRDPSTLELVTESCRELRLLAQAATLVGPGPLVLMSRPGCGNGNLAWGVVREICARELPGDRFVVVDTNA